MNEIVSIIIPIYNSENTIKKCLDSVINQSYRYLEIIMIDDGSTDMSSKICDKYALEDDRVKVFHVENGGVSSARNVGIEHSNGEYLFFLDSDDYLDPTCIEKLYNAMQQNNTMIAMCNYSEVVNNKITDVVLYNKGVVSVESVIKDFFYGRTKSLFSCAKLYKKEIIKSAFEKYIYCEDVLFVFENIHESCINASFVSDSLYYYVRHENSTTCRNKASDLMDMLEVADKIRDITISNKSDFYNASCAAAVNWSFFSYLNVNNDKSADAQQLKDLAIKKIKELRKSVLRDNEATIKTKGACLLSFGFMPLVKILYRLINI